MASLVILTDLCILQGALRFDVYPSANLFAKPSPTERGGLGGVGEHFIYQVDDYHSVYMPFAPPSA
jgi:hypothetical protein